MNTSSVAGRDGSERLVRFSRLIALGLIAACLLLTAGCAQRVYGPPPYSAYAPNALVAEAERRGFEAGLEDGSRDAARRAEYRPRRDRRYADPPGYDPAMGPYGPYRDTFRDSYLRGYAQGFRGR